MPDSIPGVFPKKSNAGIKGCSTPALYGPESDLIEFSATGSMSSIRIRVAKSDWCASRSTTSVRPSGVLSLMVKAFLFAPDKSTYAYFYFCELCGLISSPFVSARVLFNTEKGSLPRMALSFWPTRHVRMQLQRTYTPAGVLEVVEGDNPASLGRLGQ